MRLPEATQSLCQQWQLGDVSLLASALQALTALGDGEGQLLLWHKDAFLTLLAAKSGEWQERQIGRTLTSSEEPFAFHALRKQRPVFVNWGLLRGAEPFAHCAAPLRSAPLVLTLDIPLTDAPSLSLLQRWRFPRSLVSKIARAAWGEMVPPSLLSWVLEKKDGVAVWDAHDRLRWSVGSVLDAAEVPQGLHLSADFVSLRTEAGTILRRRKTAPPLLHGYALVRSEVHHRVKNDLQSLVSWLRLQARRAPLEAKAILLDAAERVRVFATVHDLLARSKGEWVALRELVQQLAATLVDQARDEGKAIHFAVIGPEVLLAPKQASTVASVIHELLHNACDHGFRPGEQGTVTVRLELQERRLCVEVVDNGCGFEVQRWDGTTLGLTIVRNLIEQDLKGTLEIVSSPGSGTAVRFSFPL